MPSNYDTITTLSKPKKSWDNIPDLVVSLERNLCGHPPPGLWKNDGKEYLDGNAHTCVEQEVFFLSVYVHDINNAGEKGLLKTMWK